MTRRAPLGFLVLITLLAASSASVVCQDPTLSRMPGGPGATTSGGEIAPEALARGLESHVDGLVKSDSFSGVVLLASGDRILLHKAWGMADREGGRPNTTETRFNLGSINKIFTAAAIHQLARRGDLDLDAPLGRYLPDYPDAEARRLVTIRHLLKHQSGIGGNIFAAPAGGTRDSVRTIAGFMQLFAGQPLKFAPGSREEYSNAGYVVLGALIEHITGATYYDYVRLNIYEPLGMAHTDSYRRDSLPAGTAFGYTKRAGEGAAPDAWRRNTAMLPGRGSSAGGGYSTTEDLLRFTQAVEQGKLPGLGGGMGIAGGAPGMNTIVETGLPGGYTLIALANMDPPAAESIGEELRAWLGASGD